MATTISKANIPGLLPAPRIPLMYFLPLLILAATTFILLPVHTTIAPSVELNITIKTNLSATGLPYNPGLDRIYSIKDAYYGEDFFDSWIWDAIKDPTHGRVNYVSKEDAIRLGLSYGEFSILHTYQVFTIMI